MTPKEISELDKIESARRKALEDTQVSGGKQALRVISSALTAFGGGTPIDFEARDRAKRAEINSEADRQTRTYIGAPAAELERQSAVSESPVSLRLRETFGTVTGKPEIFQGLPASLMISVGLPLFREWQAGQISKDELARRMLQAAETSDYHRAQLALGQERNDIARMKAAEDKGKRHDEAVHKVDQMLAGARGLPDYRNAREAIRNIDSALALAQKPNLSQQEVELLAGEIGKVATGGAAPEGLVKMLAAPTLQGRVEMARRFLSGKPGDAGYKTIMDNYTHYLRQLRANNLKTIVGSQAGIVEPMKEQVPEIWESLQRDPLYYEKIRQKAADAVPMPGSEGDASTRALHDELRSLGGSVAAP
jgi:hypothetical protein